MACSLRTDHTLHPEPTKRRPLEAPPIRAATMGLLLFLQIRFLFVGVLIMRALLFGVYVGAPDFWKLLKQEGNPTFHAGPKSCNMRPMPNRNPGPLTQTLPQPDVKPYNSLKSPTWTKSPLQLAPHTRSPRII